MEKDLITHILVAKSIVEICPDLSKWDQVYKAMATQVHPDKNQEPSAAEAMKRLNEFNTAVKGGYSFQDDAGEGKTTLTKCVIKGTQDILSKSLKNHKIIMREGDTQFKKYVPLSGQIIGDKLTWLMGVRTIPLVSVGTLPQEHVNWILSRMLEFSAFMATNELVHAGINPSSVHIVPENHGIIVTSFYHMTNIGGRMETVSGNYFNFYPHHQIASHSKRAFSMIDIELCKRTAAWLMGDKSGNGSKLIKTHNKDFVSFIMEMGTESPYKTYNNYREMLRRNFNVNKFYPLNI
jgi:hypothetical protein